MMMDIDELEARARVLLGPDWEPGKADEIISNAARWEFIRGHKDNPNVSLKDIYDALTCLDIDVAMDTLMRIAEEQE